MNLTQFELLGPRSKCNRLRCCSIFVLAVSIVSSQAPTAPSLFAKDPEQGKPSGRAQSVPSLPTKWNSEHRDAFIDALQVWKLGKDYFDDGDVSLPSTDIRPVLFRGIDQETRKLLDWPDMSLQPVVQCGCVGCLTPYEDALVEALKSGAPALKLQALAILVRLRAPSSVPLQWKALGELRQLKDRPQWQPLLAEWQACFDPQRLERKLQQKPPEGERNGADCREFFWNIRAAGVIRDARALSRLAELSTLSTGNATSLAAERSLEDFTGPEANQALACCVLGWQYTAYIRAAEALIERDKPLLTKVLLNAKVPKECRYYQGLFLARCDNTAAVPILCDEVPNYQMIDREMFAHIARLGSAEHRDMIQSLLSRVRTDQRFLAERTVQRFVAKLRRRAEKSPSEQARAIMKMEDVGAEVGVDEESPGSQVTDLDFSNYSPVQDADLEQLKHFPHLQELNLADTSITDAGLSHIETLAALRSLDLSFTRVTDKGLARLKGLPHLGRLDLYDIELTDAGLKHLEGLATLESLDLSFAKLTDAGLARLQGLTRLQSLTLLDIEVSDAGLQHLKTLANLQSLDLRQTKVTGTGLAQLEGLPRLEKLSLDGAPVSKAGLGVLKRMTRLRVLTLHRTEVSKADLAKLKEALPNCDIKP